MNNDSKNYQNKDLLIKKCYKCEGCGTVPGLILPERKYPCDTCHGSGEINIKQKLLDNIGRLEEWIDE